MIDIIFYTCCAVALICILINKYNVYKAATANEIKPDYKITIILNENLDTGRVTISSELKEIIDIYPD